MSQQILYSLFLPNFAQLQFSPPLLLAISLLSAISINSLRIFNSYSCSSYSLSIPLLDINHYIEYLIKFFIHSFFLIVHGINSLPILFLLSLYIHFVSFNRFTYFQLFLEWKICTLLTTSTTTAGPVFRVIFVELVRRSILITAAINSTFPFGI